jgi:hypothetical protein
MADAIIVAVSRVYGAESFPYDSDLKNQINVIFIAKA